MVQHAIFVAVTGSFYTVLKREALIPFAIYGVVDAVGALGLVRQHCCASSLLCSERYTDIPPIVEFTVQFVPRPCLGCFVLCQSVPSVVGDKKKISKCRP